MTERTVQPTPEQAKPASPPITRRRAAIRIGALVFGVILPLVTTLTPTEARAQATDGS